jgi:hypothetical protein
MIDIEMENYRGLTVEEYIYYYCYELDFIVMYRSVD